MAGTYSFGLRPRRALPRGNPPQEDLLDKFVLPRSKDVRRKNTRVERSLCVVYEEKRNLEYIQRKTDAIPDYEDGKRKIRSFSTRKRALRRTLIFRARSPNTKLLIYFQLRSFFYLFEMQPTSAWSQRWTLLCYRDIFAVQLPFAEQSS